MTFAEELRAASDEIASALGEAATFRRVVRGAFNANTGATSMANTDTAIIVVREPARVQRAAHFTRHVEQVVFKVRATEAAFATEQPGIGDMIVQPGDGTPQAAYRIVMSELIAARSVWRLTCERAAQQGVPTP
jgi:hypothetical protein